MAQLNLTMAVGRQFGLCVHANSTRAHSITWRPCTKCKFCARYGRTAPNEICRRLSQFEPRIVAFGNGRDAHSISRSANSWRGARAYTKSSCIQTRKQESATKRGVLASSQKRALANLQSLRCLGEKTLKEQTCGVLCCDFSGVYFVRRGW